MSDVSAVVNYFATANEGFSTTLGSTIASAATTVPLGSVTGLTNGTIFVGMIEPSGTKQQVFTGTVDTGGSQITGVKWTRGTNVGHTSGVTIVDYVTGTAMNMMSTGILKQHSQTGAHTAVTATSLSVSGASTLTGNTTVGGTLGVTGVLTPTGGLSAGSIVPNNLLASTGTSWVWQTWTPTTTNFTLGNGTITARYVQTGKHVHFELTLLWGSTTTIVGSDPQFTVPVAASARYNAANALFFPLGALVCVDTSTGTAYLGTTSFPASDNTKFRGIPYRQDLGTWVASQNSLANTQPVSTFATGDNIYFVGDYEAA